jgi:hypothetical protein
MRLSCSTFTAGSAPGDSGEDWSSRRIILRRNGFRVDGILTEPGQNPDATRKSRAKDDCGCRRCTRRGLQSAMMLPRSPPTAARPVRCMAGVEPTSPCGGYRGDTVRRLDGAALLQVLDAVVYDAPAAPWRISRSFYKLGAGAQPEAFVPGPESFRPGTGVLSSRDRSLCLIGRWEGWLRRASAGSSGARSGRLSPRLRAARAPPGCLRRRHLGAPTR